jgi:putative glutamine amidotransferase
MVPLVVIAGRVSPTAENVRGEAFGAGQRYARSVVRGGGQPLLLPPIPDSIERLPQIVRRMDAVVLHGGGDIHPRHYGEQPSTDSLSGVVPDHDEVELALVRVAIEHDLPVLAICRGLQILNVGLGGTLVQDLGQDDHWHTFHEVELEGAGRVASAIGDHRVRRAHSVHHQAVGQLGDGLSVTGHSDDGTIEAVELESASWVVGVQWHPEDTAHEDPQQQALFDALVAHAVAGAYAPR